MKRRTALGRAAAAAAAFVTCVLPRSAAAGDDDDVVKIVDGDAPKTGTGATAPAPAEPKKPTFELRGFSRSIVNAGVSRPGSAPDNAPVEEQVPYERGSLTQQVFAEARYAHGDSIRAVISGSLAYSLRLTEGNASSKDEREIAGSRLEAVLREAYVGYRSPTLDLRIGQQRIAWGNSDGISPNDVLNARDVRTRMVFDPEIVNLPTLAARADLLLGSVTIGVVAQPFFTGDKTSLYGTNWSLIQADTVRTYRRLLGAYAGDADSVNADDSGLVDSRAPTKLLDGASVGTSLKINAGGADFSVYYHFGHDRTPFVYLDPLLAARIDAAPPGQVSGAVLEGLLAQRRQAQQLYGGPLILQYVRRHHVGFDASTTAGPFVLRTEAAFDSATSFFARNTFNSTAHPTAQAVLGIEFHGAGTGKVIALEGWYMRVLDQEIPIVPTLDQANAGQLLFVQRDNVGVGAVVRWPLFGGFLFEARGFVGGAPRWFIARPELGWESSDFTIRLGTLVLDGEGASTGGHFRRNDSVYVTARYTF